MSFAVRKHASVHEFLAAAVDRGRRFVFLSTELANPTSNRIYRAIGYEPVCDVDLHRFGADA